MSRFLPLNADADAADNRADDSAADAALPERAPVALAEGSQLLDCEIAGTIGQDDCTVVYLAWDRVRACHVAVQEFLPAPLVVRVPASAEVVLRSPAHRALFDSALQGFLQEARTLAQFAHPALVKVLHSWEANGTAYRSMPYYTGLSLARMVATLGRTPTQEELGAWLLPLLDLLDRLHAQACLHPGITPDNILLTERGPVLLGFDVAQRQIEAAGVLPFAPPLLPYRPLERCGPIGALQESPASDLYALAAVAYLAITGRPPPNAIDRLAQQQQQPMPALAVLAQGRYNPHWLAALDAALALHPGDRPQSVAAMRQQMQGFDAGSAGTDGVLSVPLAATSAPLPPAGARRTRGVWGGLIALGLALLVVLAVVVGALFRTPPAPSLARQGETQPGPASAPAAVPAAPAAVASNAAPAKPVVKAPAPAAETKPPATIAPVTRADAVPPPSPASAAALTLPLAEATPAPPPRQAEPVTRRRPRRSAGSSAMLAEREAQAEREQLPQRRSHQEPLPGRCAAILQRASLEALTPTEARYYIQECQ